MSRVQCKFCGHIDHNTHDPNSIDGFFIDKATFENMLVKWESIDEMELWYYDNAIHCNRCSKCGHITNKFLEKCRKGVKNE